MIEDHIINAIKEKVATHENHTCLTLADELYNQSLLQRPEQPTINNQSFIKVKAQQKIQEEEIIILKKIEDANQQREHLAMEQ